MNYASLFADDAAPLSNALIRKGEFTDPTRGRTIPYKLYYPDNLTEKVPLIVWSHGFGGNRDGAAFLSRFLAGHGYIILHTTHIGTDSSLWEGKPGHPWDILRQTKVTRQNSLDRFYDIPFVLDQLPAFINENPEFGPFIDTDNIGMSGHSFGAMTTQVMAGMRVPDHNNNLIQIKEERFKAGILYSPVPIRHLSDAPAEELYGGITLPLQHQTGTEDASPLENFGFEQRLAVYEHSQGPRHLLIKQGGDHMVYNGTRGKLEVNPKREKHEQIIQTAALAYWDMMLKNSAEAKTFLTGPGMQDYMKGEGAYKIIEA
ncbi:MAG: hypothetical protein LRY54_04525 [Alphaproteobacteria bacterium]|nr:hypothetical protein [Alphaproteobacteria bacterium]